MDEPTKRRGPALDADRHAEIIERAARAIATRLGRATPLTDSEAFLHAIVRAFESHRR